MDTYLPEVNVTGGVMLGRVPREGYQRGWGLQFSDLPERIQNEPLFRHAVAASEALPSLVSVHKRMNIYLILTRFLPRLAHRDVIEFGAFKGGNAVFMSLVLQEIDPAAKVFALDTFAGMPATDKAIDAHSAGDFANPELDTLKSEISRLKLDTVLLPIKGLFNETFPALAAGRRFGLAHIDADIYASVKYAQDAVWPSMSPGGYVVYDDAEVSSCLGATQAVEELIMEKRVHSEQVWPHFVFRAGLQ